MAGGARPQERAPDVTGTPDWVQVGVATVVDTVREIKANKYPSEFMKKAEYEFGKLLFAIGELPQGRMVLQADEFDVLLDWVSSFKQTMHAVSVHYLGVRHWWSTTTSGADYLQRQFDVCRDPKVAIERVFLFDEWGPDIDEAIREQAARGIKTYRLDMDRARDLPEHPFVVFDGEEEEPRAFDLLATRGQLTAMRLFADPHEILFRLHQARAFIWAAERYPPDERPLTAATS